MRSSTSSASSSTTMLASASRYHDRAAASLLDEAHAQDCVSPLARNANNSSSSTGVLPNGVAVHVSSDQDGQKRTSVIKTHPSPNPNGGGSHSRKQSAAASAAAQIPPSLPLSFQELPGLEGEPLPVRLGLAPPMSSLSAIKPEYYLVRPPPRPKRTDEGDASTSAVTLDSPTAKTQHQGSSSSGGGARRHTSPRTRNPRRSNGATPSHSKGESEDWSNMGQQWNTEDYFRYETIRSPLSGRPRRRKWHGYDAVDAPYFYSYDPECLQSDQLNHHIYRQLLGRNTLSPITVDSQPSRVLDVGCGTGIWCLETASKWPAAEFIGMDLVPIQTPLKHFDAEEDDRSDRISWVVSNFLLEWPFPDGSFDFLMMRYIDSAVPEDAWDHVLSEAVRVSAPGAVIEIVTSNSPIPTNAWLIPQSEIQMLATGEESDHNTRKRKGERDTSSYVPAYEALKVVYTKMDNRRFINARNHSIIPGALLTQDVSDRRQTLVKVFPVRDNPYTLLQEKRVMSSKNVDRRYTPAAQVGALNKSTMQMQLNLNNRAVFAAMLLWMFTVSKAASRDLVWREAEKEKADELRRRGLAASTEARYDDADLEANRPFIHPWAERSEFERLVDEWRDDMCSRTGIGVLLSNLFGWKEGALGINGESRKQLERQRKMSVSTSRSVPMSPITTSLDAHALVGLTGGFPTRGRAASEGKSELSTIDDESIASSEQPSPSIASTLVERDEMLSVLGFREVATFISRKKW